MRSLTRITRPGLGILALVAASSLAGAREDLTSVSMNVPDVIQNSTLEGPLDTTQNLHIAISLPPAKQAELEAYANSVSQPSSPNYRRFLTPTQVGQMFGPSEASVQSVVSYLQSEGMKIRLVAANRFNILADCTVAQAELAFHTQLNNYQSHLSRDIKHPAYFSFNKVPQLPASITSNILCISGLESHSRPVHRAIRRKQGGTAGPFTATQTSTLYDLAPLHTAGYNGQGRTVGISSFDAFDLANVTNFCKTFSIPTPPGGAGSNISVESIDTGSEKKEIAGEGDLDIQMVIGQAPLSNVIVYDGDEDFDSDDALIDVLTQEVNDNSADVITDSYGWSMSVTSDYTVCHNLHLSMTSQGITYMAASGDDGANGQDGFDPQQDPYPQCDPEVLVVGGTVATLTSSGTRNSEVGWTYSGGSWMTLDVPFNTLPSWQKGTGVPTNTNFRLIPDIAFDAAAANDSQSDDHGSFLCYYDPNWPQDTTQKDAAIYGFSGTSCASPLFAGSLACVEQDLIANNSIVKNSAGKQRLGRLNDYIYSLNGKSSIFYDITSGNNGDTPAGNASNATVGWDTVTGWGPMDISAFEKSLVTTSSATLASVSVSPTTVQGGASSTGTVTLSAAAPSGGLAISLTTEFPSLVIVPSSVTVAAGAKTATFTVTTTKYSESFSSSITATQGSTSVNTRLSITDDSLTGLAFSPASVNGGSSSTGTLKLLAAAPTGGWKVNLSSEFSSLVVVPASVTVEAGASSATFTVTTTKYSESFSDLITATDATSSTTGRLSVVDDSINTITVNPTSVNGGASSTGTITLLGAAPTGGWKVSLSSEFSSLVVVPASVTVAAGQKTATFAITTAKYSESFSNLITATDATSSKTVRLAVVDDSISSLTFSPSSVVGGKSSTGTVTLLAAAPAGGWKVTLSSENSTYVGVPASVTVAAGAKTATFTVTTKAYTTNYSELVTATDATSTKSTRMNVTTS